MKVKNFPTEYGTNIVYFLSSNFHQQSFNSPKLIELRKKLE